MSLNIGAAYVDILPDTSKLVGDIKSALNKAKGTTVPIDADTSPLQGELKGAAKEADKQGEKTGEQFGEGVKSGISGKKKLIYASVAGVAAGVGAAFTAALSEAMDVEQSTDKLAAQLGLTEKESKRIGKTAGSLYSQAYGDSLSEVNDAIKNVMQNGLVPEGATNKQLESITGKVLNLAEAFDVDVSEATRGVSQLLRTGLAKNATEAFDVITKGFQSGVDKSQDYLDTLNEYGTQFRKLGIDGKTATGLLSQGLKAGARDADVVADALKEFSIRAVDGSKTTAEGFQRLGLEGGKMADAIAAGGPKASQALDTVLDRLRGVKDPAERAQIAVQLFGTQAEDLGDALYALDPSSATDALGKVGGAADKMGKTLNDNANTKVTEFTRKLKTGLVDFLAFEVIPAFDKIGGAIDWVKSKFAGAELGGKFKSSIESVKSALDGLNDIASAFWDTFGGPISDYLGEWADNMAQIIGGAMKTLEGLIDFIAGVFTGDWGRAWDGIKKIFSGIWQSFGGVIDNAWEAVKLAVKAGIAAIIAIVKAAGSAILDLGKWLVGKIVEGIKAAGSAISDAAGWIKNRVVEFVSARIEDFKDIGGWVIRRIVDGVKAAVSVISEVGGWIKNRFVEAVKFYASAFGDVGGWVINRIVDGVKAVGSAFESVGGWIKNRVFDAVRAAKDGFLSIGGTMLDWIVDGLKKGGNALVGFVNRIIRVINKIPGVDIGMIKGFAMGGTTDDVPGYATGGVAHHNSLKGGSHITRPMMVVGEEAPRHKEFIVPTNPAYRQRALGLFSQLGSELGVPGFKKGGVSGSVSADSGVSGSTNTGTNTRWLPSLSDLAGKLPGVGDLPDWLKGTGKWLVGKAKDYITDKIKSIFSSGGGRTDRAWTGLKPRVKAAVNFARAHGWVGQINEGFRTYQQQAALYAKYLNGTGNLAARPGTSNHEQGEAVDVSATEQFAFAMGQMSPGDRLYRKVAGEPWHFSITGHRKGGVVGGPFVGSYRDGGVIPRDGLAYVHQGETVTPAGGTFAPRFFIGDREITEIVRVEMDERERSQFHTFAAGGIR